MEETVNPFVDIKVKRGEFFSLFCQQCEKISEGQVVLPKYREYLLHEL